MLIKATSSGEKREEESVPSRGWGGRGRPDARSYKYHPPGRLPLPGAQGDPGGPGLEVACATAGNWLSSGSLLSPSHPQSPSPLIRKPEGSRGPESCQEPPDWGLCWSEVLDPWPMGCGGVGLPGLGAGHTHTKINK